MVAGIGFVAFLHPGFNGAVLGVLCIAGALAAETIILGWYLWGQTRIPGPMFARVRSAADSFDA